MRNCEIEFTQAPWLTAVIGSRELGIRDIVDVSLVLRSPEGFDPNLHEPKPWSTVGTVRRIVGAINDPAYSEDSSQPARAKDLPREGLERNSITQRFQFCLMQADSPIPGNVTSSFSS